jgi:hypothetical protein
MLPERVAKAPYWGYRLMPQSDTLSQGSWCDAFFQHSPKVGLERVF